MHKELILSPEIIVFAVFKIIAITWKNESTIFIHFVLFLEIKSNFEGNLEDIQCKVRSF